MPDGSTRPATATELADAAAIPEGAVRFRPKRDNITEAARQRSVSVPRQSVQTRLIAVLEDKHPGAGATSESGATCASRSFLRRLDDFPVTPINNLWQDVRWGFDASDKRYVVETHIKILQRCMLMTTDPGELVLDPTCGSGTTAYVAEQWGSRWLTTDTSRVAVAIARQRLLTAKYDFFRLKDDTKGVAGGLHYTTVPHVALKSIAQSAVLDPIFEKHEPILETKLAAANAALKRISEGVRNDLRSKLALKQKQ